MTRHKVLIEILKYKQEKLNSCIGKNKNEQNQNVQIFFSFLPSKKKYSFLFLFNSNLVNNFDRLVCCPLELAITNTLKFKPTSQTQKFKHFYWVSFSLQTQLTPFECFNISFNLKLLFWQWMNTKLFLNTQINNKIKIRIWDNL